MRKLSFLLVCLSAYANDLPVVRNSGQSQSIIDCFNESTNPNDYFDAAGLNDEIGGVQNRHTSPNHFWTIRKDDVADSFPNYELLKTRLQYFDHAGTNNSYTVKLKELLMAVKNKKTDSLKKGESVSFYFHKNNDPSKSVGYIKFCLGDEDKIDPHKLEVARQWLDQYSEKCLFKLEMFQLEKEKEGESVVGPANDRKVVNRKFHFRVNNQSKDSAGNLDADVGYGWLYTEIQKDVIRLHYFEGCEHSSSNSYGEDVLSHCTGPNVDESIQDCIADLPYIKSVLPISSRSSLHLECSVASKIGFNFTESYLKPFKLCQTYVESPVKYGFFYWWTRYREYRDKDGQFGQQKRIQTTIEESLKVCGNFLVVPSVLLRLTHSGNFLYEEIKFYDSLFFRGEDFLKEKGWGSYKLDSCSFLIDYATDNGVANTLYPSVILFNKHTQKNFVYDLRDMDIGLGVTTLSDGSKVRYDISQVFVANNYHTNIVVIAVLENQAGESIAGGVEYNNRQGEIQTAIKKVIEERIKAGGAANGGEGHKHIEIVKDILTHGSGLDISVVSLQEYTSSAPLLVQRASAVNNYQSRQNKIQAELNSVADQGYKTYEDALQAAQGGLTLPIVTQKLFGMSQETANAQEATEKRVKVDVDNKEKELYRFIATLPVSGSVYSQIYQPNQAETINKAVLTIWLNKFYKIKKGVDLSITSVEEPYIVKGGRDSFICKIKACYTNANETISVPVTLTINKVRDNIPKYKDINISGAKDVAVAKVSVNSDKEVEFYTGYGRNTNAGFEGFFHLENGLYASTASVMPCDETERIAPYIHAAGRDEFYPDNKRNKYSSEDGNTVFYLLKPGFDLEVSNITKKINWAQREDSSLGPEISEDIVTPIHCGDKRAIIHFQFGLSPESKDSFKGLADCRLVGLEAELLDDQDVVQNKLRTFNLSEIEPGKYMDDKTNLRILNGTASLTVELSDLDVLLAAHQSLAKSLEEPVKTKWRFKLETTVGTTIAVPVNIKMLPVDGKKGTGIDGSEIGRIHHKQEKKKFSQVTIDVSTKINSAADSSKFSHSNDETGCYSYSTYQVVNNCMLNCSDGLGTIEIPENALKIDDNKLLISLFSNSNDADADINNDKLLVYAVNKNNKQILLSEKAVNSLIHVKGGNGAISISISDIYKIIDDNTHLKIVIFPCARIRGDIKTIEKTMKQFDNAGIQAELEGYNIENAYRVAYMKANKPIVFQIKLEKSPALLLQKDSYFPEFTDVDATSGEITMPLEVRGYSQNDNQLGVSAQMAVKLVPHHPISDVQTMKSAYNFVCGEDKSVVLYYDKCELVRLENVTHFEAKRRFPFAAHSLQATPILTRNGFEAHGNNIRYLCRNNNWIHLKALAYNGHGFRAKFLNKTPLIITRGVKNEEESDLITSNGGIEQDRYLTYKWRGDLKDLKWVELRCAPENVMSDDQCHKSKYHIEVKGVNSKQICRGNLHRSNDSLLNTYELMQDQRYTYTQIGRLGVLELSGCEPIQTKAVPARVVIEEREVRLQLARPITKDANGWDLTSQKTRKDKGKGKAPVGSTHLDYEYVSEALDFTLSESARIFDVSDMYKLELNGDRAVIFTEGDQPNLTPVIDGPIIKVDSGKVGNIYQPYVIGKYFVIKEVQGIDAETTDEMQGEIENDKVIFRKGRTSVFIKDIDEHVYPIGKDFIHRYKTYTGKGEKELTKDNFIFYLKCQLMNHAESNEAISSILREAGNKIEKELEKLEGKMSHDREEFVHGQFGKISERIANIKSKQGWWKAFFSLANFAVSWSSAIMSGGMSTILARVGMIGIGASTAEFATTGSTSYGLNFGDIGLGFGLDRQGITGASFRAFGGNVGVGRDGLNVGYDVKGGNVGVGSQGISGGYKINDNVSLSASTSGKIGAKFSKSGASLGLGYNMRSKSMYGSLGYTKMLSGDEKAGMSGRFSLDVDGSGFEAYAGASLHNTQYAVDRTTAYDAGLSLMKSFETGFYCAGVSLMYNNRKVVDLGWGTDPTTGKPKAGWSDLLSPATFEALGKWAIEEGCLTLVEQRESSKISKAADNMGGNAQQAYENATAGGKNISKQDKDKIKKDTIEGPLSKVATDVAAHKIVTPNGTLGMSQGRVEQMVKEVVEGSPAVSEVINEMYAKEQKADEVAVDDVVKLIDSMQGRTHGGTTVFKGAPGDIRPVEEQVIGAFQKVADLGVSIDVKVGEQTVIVKYKTDKMTNTISHLPSRVACQTKNGITVAQREGNNYIGSVRLNEEDFDGMDIKPEDLRFNIKIIDGERVASYCVAAAQDTTKEITVTEVGNKIKENMDKSEEFKAIQAKHKQGKKLSPDEQKKMDLYARASKGGINTKIRYNRSDIYVKTSSKVLNKGALMSKAVETSADIHCMGNTVSIDMTMAALAVGFDVATTHLLAARNLSKAESKEAREAFKADCLSAGKKLKADLKDVFSLAESKVRKGINKAFSQSNKVHDLTKTKDGVELFLHSLKEEHEREMAMITGAINKQIKGLEGPNGQSCDMALNNIKKALGEGVKLLQINSEGELVGKALSTQAEIEGTEANSEASGMYLGQVIDHLSDGGKGLVNKLLASKDKRRALTGKEYTQLFREIVEAKNSGEITPIEARSLTSDIMKTAAMSGMNNIAGLQDRSGYIEYVKLRKELWGIEPPKDRQVSALDDRLVQQAKGVRSRNDSQGLDDGAKAFAAGTQLSYCGHVLSRNKANAMLNHMKKIKLTKQGDGTYRIEGAKGDSIDELNGKLSCAEGIVRAHAAMKTYISHNAIALTNDLGVSVLGPGNMTQCAVLPIFDAKLKGNEQDLQDAWAQSTTKKFEVRSHPGAGAESVSRRAGFKLAGSNWVEFDEKDPVVIYKNTDRSTETFVLEFPKEQKREIYRSKMSEQDKEDMEIFDPVTGVDFELMRGSRWRSRAIIIAPEAGG